MLTLVLKLLKQEDLFIIGSVVKWLEHRDCDQRSLGSKPSGAILLCPWERHSAAHSQIGDLDSNFKFQSYLCIIKKSNEKFQLGQIWPA